MSNPNAAKNVGPGGVFSSDRLIIARLARIAKGGLLSVAEAAEALDMSRRAAALKLAALARRGWLLHVRRGLYFIVPLETEPGRPVTLDDPWVLAREVFSPCYIGGWSAAEYWGLTEQLFRSTLVVTAAHIRDTSVNLLGNDYRLFKVPRARIEDTTLVWRGSERVPVSGRERTIVDCLRHPGLCGGVRHLVDMMSRYKESREYDPQSLLSVARKVANGAAWKRFGYLVGLLWPDEPALVHEAEGHRTAGNVKLDPTVRRRGTLLRRWQLWVNVAVEERHTG